AFPKEVMRDVNTSLSADDLRRDPATYQGARVIVGGEILSTQPKPGQTEIELLARRLDDGDAPEHSDRAHPALAAGGRPVPRLLAVGAVALRPLLLRPLLLRRTRPLLAGLVVVSGATSPPSRC